MDMLNSNVCPKCGQIYETALEKCPLCGAVSPQTSPAAPEHRTSASSGKGGKFLASADKKALKREEEQFLQNEERRYRRMKHRNEEDAPLPATDPHVPTGFIVASVFVLIAALFVGGSFLLWKSGVIQSSLYDRLSGVETTPPTLSAPAPESTDTTLIGSPQDTASDTSVTQDSASTEATEPTSPPVELPFDFDIDDPVLILVNDDNPIPADFPTDDMATLGTGAKVSRLCMDDLQQMVSDCRDAKHYPGVYEGYDPDANDTSEYRTGIAVDIFPETDQARDVATQIESETLIWLWEHCWEYGFIVRYPEGKEDITGHDYEPWHFRYVGKEVAEYMYENDLCFEEMVALLQLAG